MLVPKVVKPTDKKTLFKNFWVIGTIYENKDKLVSA